MVENKETYNLLLKTPFLFLINKFYTILFLPYCYPFITEVKRKWVLMTEEILTVVATETETTEDSEAATAAPGK